MEEPNINLLQDLYTASDGSKRTMYTAAYIDPNDDTNNVTEQANSPAEALNRLYEGLERRGISRDTLPQPRLL